jgi:excinuclease ABC subunit A
LLVVVTGVSGAGKSTLINQIPYPALARRLNGSDLMTGRNAGIKGLSHRRAHHRPTL